MRVVYRCKQAIKSDRLASGAVLGLSNIIHVAALETAWNKFSNEAVRFLVVLVCAYVSNIRRAIAISGAYFAEVSGMCD